MVQKKFLFRMTCYEIKFGTIEQSAPIAYEIDESGHKSKIKANYQKTGENFFQLPDGYDHTEYFLDPSLTFSPLRVLNLMSGASRS